jgi:hypothetical protein
LPIDIGTWSSRANDDEADGKGEFSAGHANLPYAARTESGGLKRPEESRSVRP